jgi:hypothetical protein
MEQPTGYVTRYEVPEALGLYLEHFRKRICEHSFFSKVRNVEMLVLSLPEACL